MGQGKPPGDSYRTSDSSSDDRLNKANCAPKESENKVETERTSPLL